MSVIKIDSDKLEEQLAYVQGKLKYPMNTEKENAYWEGHYARLIWLREQQYT